MDLPDWLHPLPDAAQMRAVDRCAIDERGVPGIDLMERAGSAAARAAEDLAPDGSVLVLCGAGNNGGDGFVVARLLRKSGRAVDVWLVGDPDQIGGDARVNLDRLPGEVPVPFAGEAAGYSLIVDALLGTGFSGDVRGEAAAAIDAVNASMIPVLAIDVPSGVDASSGEAGAHAVRAARTVTFHTAKAGLWINPGKRHRGALQVADIGVPGSVPLEADCGLIDGHCAALLPHSGAQSTKFTSGHLVIAGGSRDLSGAPRLAGLGAMRAGAGYVTVAVPRSIQPAVSLATPELMGLALDEEDGAPTAAAAAIVLERVRPAGALAIGPGLGRRDATQEFVRTIVRGSERPFVLDADGLFAFAGTAGALADRHAPGVLTPHAGELGRLLGCPSAEIEAQRLAHVRRAAQVTGCVVVLKGDDTLVAAPGGPVAVSEGNSPALATAGTGDVLCGAVGAFLAQGVDPFHAACAAVWLHARAGRLAAREVGAAEGVIASDVAQRLPRARAEAEGL